MKLFVGSWDNQLFSTIDALFPERFQTFDGEVLHVASDYDDYPLIYETDDVDGMNIRILKALGAWLNFTFTTTSVASDDLWGSLENGTWTGLLGDVYRGEKNITINYFTVVYERARDFDYTATYFTEGFGFALRVPPPLPAWRNLFLPFTPLLWASVVGAVVLTTPIIYLLIHVTEGTTFTDVAILVFKSLVQQSSSTASKKGAARLLVGVWWIGGLILALSYTCNLIAVLTVPVFPSIIATIEGLADSNFRVSMVDYGEFVPEALATSADQYLKALGDRMDLVENYADDEISYRRLLDLLLEGRHAITETYSYLRNMLADDEQGRLHTYVLREQIYTGALAFFLPKHTPWRPRLDRGIERLVEAGLVDKWYRDLMGGMAAGDLQQQQQGTGEEKALTISNLQGPFLALALGLGLASLAFLVEVSLHGQAAGVEAKRKGLQN
ncbi:glutamate receptor ionotropic, delta-2-like [Penaeus chinensis]|uniref:glutamate receptor ionotropic, delta-2-like n=1 Tax=Penaeus chinensis TaxID=139456 RepID=UPI001FB74B1D|nr:glutamate receptor ionotropic, delta-2-like [Penaeus chinensis]